jgi:hypothetical protein
MESVQPEILLQGTYLYYEKDVNYSQEEFRFMRMPDAQSYQFNAEILSRVESGEFLKIKVRYEMNNFFTPQSVQIEKSLGTKYAKETFRIEPLTLEMLYTFEGSQSSHDFKRTVSTKHYLTSPAFCTTAAFTLTNKFNSQERTPITLISSVNEWNFETNPIDKVIFAEFKSRDVQDFKVLGKSLSASHLCLFENDSSYPNAEDPVELFLSKHYSVPYQMNYGDLKIVVKNLKKSS